ELQGRVAGDTAWLDADTDELAIAVGADALSGLVPGEDRTFQIELMNDGSIPLTVGNPTIAATGDVFTGAGPATVTTDWTPAAVAEGATVTVIVTVTTPNDWADTYQGGTGELTLTFQASTDSL